MRKPPKVVLAFLTVLLILALALTAYLYSLSEESLLLAEIILIFFLYLWAYKLSSYNLEWSVITSARKFKCWLILSVAVILVTIAGGLVFTIAIPEITLLVLAEAVLILAALRIFFLRVGMMTVY